MAVLNSVFPEKWHEQFSIIMLLEAGPFPRKELKEKLRSKQKRGIYFSLGFEPHSDSAYNYWIRSLKEDGIIHEYGGKLGLTKLGEWVAKSHFGTVGARTRFVLYLMCSKCSIPLTRLPKPMEVSRSGNWFLDLQCPRCGQVSIRTNLSGVCDSGQFEGFYDQAVKELAQFV